MNHPTKITIETHDHEVAKLFKLLIALVRADDHEDEKALRRLRKSMVGPREDLEAAVDAARDSAYPTSGGRTMATPKPTKMKALTADAPPELLALQQELNDDVEVMSSATTLIDGIAAMIQTAIDKILADGVVTKAQLQPIYDTQKLVASNRVALAAAVLANTPTPPPGP